MPTEMLDRLQEDKLQGLEARIDSYETATATGGGDDEAAAIADFFVDEGIGVRQSSLRLWDYHWTRALAAKIPDRREHGAKLLSLLERGGRVVRRGAAIARAYADLSGRAVARLAQFEEQSKAFPLWVKECAARWEMLGRPHKPLKRERIAESQAAYERGEGEPVSDVIARLEQGGPLVLE
ncbi:MAG TPA: hypothetical protein DDY78_11045 [Planctomycetales bacterium]|jgi:hypothetical protein|nr:hypothetical protein [Planctomycetales bacterium]